MTPKVRVQRWASPRSPVIGPPLIILDIDRAVEALMLSGFMRPWIAEQIKTHLLSGGQFLNKGAELSQDEAAMTSNGNSLYMHVRSEYRLATDDEVLNYVDNQEFANVTGKKISKHAQETGYVLHYHEGPKLIEAYDSLPRQARIILDLLMSTGRESFTEASIQVILAENVDRLSTKQDPMAVFGFYRRRFITEGHLEEVE